VAGAAVGLSAAKTTRGHIAKKHKVKRGPRGPRGPRGKTGPAGKDGTNGTNGTNGAPGPKGATGATGPTGGIGVTGATGATGITYLDTSGPAGATTSFVNVLNNLNGLTMDIECGGGGDQAIVYVAGPADSKSAMTWIDSSGGLTVAGSVYKLGPYPTAGNPASGTQVAMANAANPATLNFSYSTQAGKVVTGTLSFLYGTDVYQTGGTKQCIASGSVQSN